MSVKQLFLTLILKSLKNITKESLSFKNKESKKDLTFKNNYQDFTTTAVVKNNIYSEPVFLSRHLMQLKNGHTT